MSWDNVIKRVADLARPWVLYANGTASAFAMVYCAVKPGVDLVAASALIAADGAFVAALYGAKAFEETRKAGHNAEVQKAQAAGPGELPADQRVKL